MARETPAGAFRARSQLHHAHASVRNSVTAIRNIFFATWSRYVGPQRRTCAVIGHMSAAEEAASAALDRMTKRLDETGLLAAIRSLQQEVWAVNVDRFEPDELGDTPRSLGLLTFENFTTRALRRFNHDELEPTDKHWNIEGLRVTTPNGVLTFELDGARIAGMKVPPAEQRAPRWERFADWDNESNTRLEIARENSKVLGEYTTPEPGQRELADFHDVFGRRPGMVAHFLYVWAGEHTSPLTSGWLTVPALGGHPFAAIKNLWHDDDNDLPHGTRTPSRGPAGPSFDQKPAAQPSITLKPKPAIDGEA